MRYKILALASILLLASPRIAFSQDTSPIVVTTGKPVPSVVKSGEPFKVTYRAEYIDSVLIVEDQILQPGGSADQFEVVKLEIVASPNRNSPILGVIHVQEFIYTFRIIKPEKGAKKIPSFDFVWVEKKAGTTQNIAKETNELHKFPTNEVGVGYISSVVKPVDIRDEILFSPPRWTGIELRRIGYFVIFLFSALFLLVSVKFLGQPKTQRAGGKTAGEIPETQGVAESALNILPKKARKNFLRELRTFDSDMLVTDEKDLRNQTETEIYTSLRRFILAELSEGSVRASASDTPDEIYSRLRDIGDKERKKMGSKYPVILKLSEKMRVYYQDMESGKTVFLTELLKDVKEFIDIVENLSWKMRIWKTIIRRKGVGNDG